MKILNFGSVNIDSYFRVDHIVRPGETISAESVEKKPGGKGLNQSIAISKTCNNLFHAGLYGKDGLFIKELFEDNNIDTSYFKKTSSPTGNAIIQVDKNGENSIFLYKGSNYDIEDDFIENVLSNFSQDDFLVLQNEISNLDKIIDLGHKRKMKIALNPSPIDDLILNLDLNKIDILILNETEAKDISGEETKDDIVEYFKKNYPNLQVVLTLGSDGSIYFDKDQIINQKSYLVDTVDTTGAGDTFMGYFVASIYKEKTIKEALDIASLASALACTKNGASTSIPSLDEVLKFKESLKWKNKEY